MDTTGAVVSGFVYVKVNISVEVLPASSLAVTVIRFSPSPSAISETAQLVVPDAVPDHPLEFDHDTWVIP